MNDPSDAVQEEMIFTTNSGLESEKQDSRDPSTFSNRPPP